MRLRLGGDWSLDRWELAGLGGARLAGCGAVLGLWSWERGDRFRLSRSNGGVRADGSVVVMGRFALVVEDDVVVVA